MTINESRTDANIATRATRLYADGYRIRTASDDDTCKLIRNDEGVIYRVDTVFDTCTCPYYAKWDGNKMCKHVLGWQQLEADQDAAKEEDAYQSEEFWWQVAARNGVMW